MILKILRWPRAAWNQMVAYWSTLLHSKNEAVDSRCPITALLRVYQEFPIWITAEYAKTYVPCEVERYHIKRNQFVTLCIDLIIMQLSIHIYKPYTLRITNSRYSLNFSNKLQTIFPFRTCKFPRQNNWLNTKICIFFKPHLLASYYKCRSPFIGMH